MPSIPADRRGERAPPPFSKRVLAWFDRHGRRHLPWQQNPTRYRVWVSEIMLQQTQVATVIPYYSAFMRRFPTLAALAEADVDDVLALWSGLGYYARGRNLHRAARQVVDRHGGELPDDIDALQALPGIGRSTAGAILALADGRRHPILDGNVKRVLARHAAVAGWPGTGAVAAELWRLAESYTPACRVRAYTQAMMDLGATLCTRSRPQCVRCPVAADCAAYRDGRVDQFPGRRPRRALPLKQVQMLLLLDPNRRVLLEKRPPHGVWGGLWAVPECAAEDDPEDWCRRELGVRPASLQRWAALRHTFSHFRLDIVPVRIALDASATSTSIADRADRRWAERDAAAAAGLAAPVRRLLTLLFSELS